MKKRSVPALCGGFGCVVGVAAKLLAGSGVASAALLVKLDDDNGSSGLVETITAYTPLQMWRHAHLGTTDGTGNAADNADPDKDGLENLVEYAFALNPLLADSAGLPAWGRDEGLYVLAFTQPANVAGITYTAEFSSTLRPDSWSPAERASTGPDHVFFSQANGPRLHLRLRVMSP